MNTSDVRNMESGQWLYWAVAVPMTAAVVFLGLLWTGELRKIVRWVQSFGPHQHSYQPLPEDTYYDNYGPRTVGTSTPAFTQAGPAAPVFGRRCLYAR